MSRTQKYQLGEPVPNVPHSVVSNIPTMADVCAYEEKDPEVSSAMKQGYPRFVRHHWVHELTDAVLAHFGLEHVFAALVYRSEGLLEMLQTLEPRIQSRALQANVFGTDGLLLYVDQSYEDSVRTLKAFVQHSGIQVSSRNAEFGLAKMGLLSLSEECLISDSDLEKKKASVRSHIQEVIGAHSEEAIHLTASGMNAFYSAFKAVQAVQRSKGRTQWIQLGWLYVDSGAILNQYLDTDESLEEIYDPSDTEMIVERIQSSSDSLSALVIECPTNPFCQIADLKKMAQAVWDAGGLVIVDPSVASIYNISCLEFSDVLVTSVTKYLAYTADVMAGALALNHKSKSYDSLKKFIGQSLVPLYSLDLLRLSETTLTASARVEQMNTNCQHLARFLKDHPKVRKLYYAGANENSEAYLKHENAYGSIISVELKGSLENFYDHLQLVKGPSFGAEFTIVCPYFYLAHYDLVLDTSPESLFGKLGIDRNLIRISVGCEPIEQLIALFSEALEQA